MGKSISKKAKVLAIALFFASSSFAQLNNCINTKDHPLIVEIKDSIKANNNYVSVLAYAVIKGDRLGLSNSKILNLAYAWTACKKISNLGIRKEEELKFLDKVLTDEEFKKLVIGTEIDNGKN
ncbi:MAG: hypothetical protein FJX80_02710 [Bacteroidetes bacterium]|nr:hypothetical protein [Bacteroidota bacterium]